MASRLGGFNGAALPCGLGPTTGRGPDLLARIPGTADDACPSGFLGISCVAVASRVDPQHRLASPNGARRARDQALEEVEKEG